MSEPKTFDPHGLEPESISALAAHYGADRFREDHVAIRRLRERDAFRDQVDAIRAALGCRVGESLGTEDIVALLRAAGVTGSMVDAVEEIRNTWRTRAAAELSVVLWLAVPAAVTPVFETVDQIWRNMERRGAAKLAVLFWLAAHRRRGRDEFVDSVIEDNATLARAVIPLRDALVELEAFVERNMPSSYAHQDELVAQVRAALAAADKPSGMNGGGA